MNILKFLKKYKTRKVLIKEIEELENKIQEISDSKFEEYFLKNTTISTTSGLEISFKGKELVKILAASFWDLVKDSDNYVICDLYSADGMGVEVTIKKKGKLSPSDKIKNLEKMLYSLIEVSDPNSEKTKEIKEFLKKEEELKKKYNELNR